MLVDIKLKNNGKSEYNSISMVNHLLHTYDSSIRSEYERYTALKDTSLNCLQHGVLNKIKKAG